MNILQNITPQPLFNFFEKITQIPRGSGEEEKISNYIVNFAKTRGLKYNQDEALNVVVFKDAAPGYENSPGIILQSHMDMVNEKDGDHIHNFAADPLKLTIDTGIDGDFIKAIGTTLGADNGYGVALMLALLDGNHNHGPLAALFTTQEETTMKGAHEFNYDLLRGYKYFLSLDGNGEKFDIGSAACLTQYLKFPIAYTAVAPSYKTYEIKVEGLKGGHSAMEINKGRANANILLGRILYKLRTTDFYLAHLEGGTQDNAIPREALAYVMLEDGEALAQDIKTMERIFYDEYYKTEANLSVKIQVVSGKNCGFSLDTTRKIIQSILLVPHGVQHMSKNFKDTVETSNNLGIIRTDKDFVSLNYLSRSSSLSLLNHLQGQTIEVSNLLQGEYSSGQYSPPWAYKPNSKLEEVAAKVYRGLWGKDPEFVMTHGALECGIFCENLPQVEMVAFGPVYYGAHSPQERLNVDSSRRVWGFVVELLERLQ